MGHPDQRMPGLVEDAVLYDYEGMTLAEITAELADIFTDNAFEAAAHYLGR